MERVQHANSFKRFRGMAGLCLGVVLGLSHDLSAALWSGTPVVITSNIQVESFALSNANPCPGDTVTITYCVRGLNQYYLPNSSAAVTLKDTALTTTDFVEPSQVGQWMLYAKGGAISPPMTVWDYNKFQGGNDMGALVTYTCQVKTIAVTIPTDVNWGGTYNLIVAIGEGANNVGHPWNAQEVHLPVTICTPSASQRSLIKAAEGTAAAGQPILYWLDYTISNDTNVVVTDNLDSNLIFLDGAPGFSGVTANQSCPCTVSWNLGNADAASSPPYVKKGRLWIYVQVKAATPAGTAINNTATMDGNSTTPLNSNPVNLVTGSGINVSVSKEQLDASGSIPVSSLNDGQQLTYRLHFTLSGLGLKCFSDFDQLTAGTNYNGTAPPGWTAVGQDGNPATLANWQVLDKTGTSGDHFLKATTTNYALLRDDCTASLNAQGNFCEGTIITEAYMGTTATDLGIALRTNSQSGTNWRGVWLLMSKDTSFGTGCSGNLAIQFNSGASRTVVGCYTAPIAPDSGQWYTIKAFVQKEGCNYRYRAKYWVQGTPEPAGWFVDYLDTTNNCNTDFECAGGAGMNAGWQWRPGFGNQGDVNAFDNWRVLANNYLQDAVLYDSVPAGVDYVSSSPTAQGIPLNNNLPGDMVRWDFTNNLNGAQSGKTYDASGYMQWTAVVDCSEGVATANNRASVNATNPGGPWNSNTTTLGIVCGTPTYTVTSTATRTPTATATPTPSPTATPTSTLTRTPTPTASITPSPTPSYTQTLTYTPTSTRTSSPTPSVTYSATPSFTPTATPSNSPTPSVTFTVTPSFTPTSTRTASPTPSLTYSSTQTYTATVTPSATSSVTATPSGTPTRTPTASPTLTYSSSPTQSPGPSPTFTVTRTDSPTPTLTYSSTPTDTATATPSATSSLTASPSSTPTRTPSASPTLTFTDSPTQSPGPSPTFTATLSNSPTVTVTPTVTPTRTPTATPSLTSTDSPTQSPGPSATDTSTLTDSPTQTATSTITVTRTPTASPTASWTDSPTQSPGPSATDTSTLTASPTQTLTYSLTATPSSSATPSATPTASPTLTVTPTATSTPPNTFTSTSTASPSATRSSTPSASPTATLTKTPSATLSASPTATATRTSTLTRTVTPSITQSFTYTVSPTVTDTPVPMPHELKLAAYNAAGELVKLIYEGPAQYVPGQLQLSSDQFVGGSGSVTITFPGILSTGGSTLTWSGTNDSAMLVQGGTYSIKAEITDQWGQTTALVKPVQVIPGGVQQSLRIYNSAGEIVRTIPLTPVPGATRLELSSDSYAVASDPSTGSIQQPFKVDVIGNAGASPAYWDGLNDLGAPVASGTYQLQLVSEEGGRETVVTARSLSVLKAPESTALLASAVLGPNPVGAGQAAWLVYDPSLLAGRRMEALVYSLDGALVGWSGDSAQSGRIPLPLGPSLASGIYLVRVQVHQGSALVQSRTLKLAVVR
jgi:hypothetical protein